MKKTVKRSIAIVLVLLTMFTMCADVFAENYRTLYAEDGRSKAFPESKVEAQLKVGWYTEPVQRLYAPGKSKVFKKSQVDAQLKVGWYTEPLVLMTALDGRTKYVVKSKVAANKKVGWYVGKPVKVYAEDGRTKYISAEDVAANEKVGWYTEPVQRLYAPDKSKLFKKSQVAAQLKVGWYTYPVTKIYSEKGETKIIKTADLKSWTSKGWSTTVIRVVTESTNCLSVNNWAYVSPVQQFEYMNKGLAYGYMSNGKLIIVTPEKEITIKETYWLLGDIISDDKGNFYVVWGNPNRTGDVNDKTMFISKHKPDGTHVKTAGFAGLSPMGCFGNTQYAFDAGNCDSAIANGIMTVNYAREMYNGHQSNNAISVNIETMNPYGGFVPYTSHSFNQRVIWSKKANSFIFADHGDAYDRGFIISNSGTKRELSIFKFFLQANANYDMYVVNKTYAQLGSLLETDKGVVLVGASAKSISEKAKTEKQNLFVQIFDPTATEVTKSMFVGGQERKGATSFDINDNKNSPLTPVTDYGVQWLTNYTDGSVIAPHAVVADNKIVVLWNKEGKGAYYMVLASDGKVIKPAAALDKTWSLNSMEDPIYHAGKVYWASTENNRIVVRSIKVN